MLLTASPVGTLTNYAVTTLPVSGGVNTTGIAVDVGTRVYGVTDAFEDNFEIRSLDAPYNLVATLTLDDLAARHGRPPGPFSGGQDGMTSVTYHDGYFYVVAIAGGVTDREDAIFKIAADGSSDALFADPEIHNDAGTFNYSEIVPGPSAGQFFLGTSFGLIELDGGGNEVQTIQAGDFDGVAVVGNALFAATHSGVIYRDPT